MTTINRQSATSLPSNQVAQGQASGPSSQPDTGSTATIPSDSLSVGSNGTTPAPAPTDAPNSPDATTNNPQTNIVPPATLTAEEQGFVQQGLLPTNYAELKAIAQAQGTKAAMAWYQQGKQGPFSDDYGNPNSMLNAARTITNNPQLSQLVKGCKKGDIIVVAYNSSSDVIANATHGPFAHAILCTDSGPPPDFIEAIGMTGNPNDPSNNKVRRSGFNDHFGNNASYRKLSPADQLPEPQRSQAIDAAVKYATDHLGTPYDYTFGETQVGQAFYCSSLAYYAYTKGAKLDIPISKAGSRDTLIEAIGSMMDSLQPKDRLALMSQTVEMINARPAPSQQQLIDFAVTKLLPNCVTTQNLAKTPADQAHLKAAIEKFATGKGMPRFTAANQRLANDQKAGKFKTPIIGGIRKLFDRVRIGTAAFSDVYHSFDGTGMSHLQALGMTRKLLWGLLPYSEAISAFVFGAKDGRTRTLGHILNVTEWIKNHKPLSWISGWLPSRAAMRVDNSFISPTDLAWANLPHQDYNVKPGMPLDRTIAK